MNILLPSNCTLLIPGTHPGLSILILQIELQMICIPPKMKASQQLPVPTKDHDLHLWTKFCGFLEFLGEFASNGTKRAHLVDAATLPRYNDPKYGKLHKWTNNYMAKVHSLSKTDVQYMFHKYMKDDGSK